jgi:hypothetical protein
MSALERFADSSRTFLGVREWDGLAVLPPLTVMGLLRPRRELDNLEILPLDVTQIAQTLLQAVDRRPPLVRENTDAPHRVGLLRPRRERPSRRAAEQRDEVASM